MNEEQSQWRLRDRILKMYTSMTYTLCSLLTFRTVDGIWGNL
jgi:hypothetical protein